MPRPSHRPRPLRSSLLLLPLLTLAGCSCGLGGRPGCAPDSGWSTGFASGANSCDSDAGIFFAAIAVVYIGARLVEWAFE